MRKKLFKLGAVASAILLGGYSIANASVVDTLTLSDGAGHSVTLGVGGSPILVGATTTTSSSSTGAGFATWSGSIGLWTLTAETGTSSPLIGTTQTPQLGLTFFGTSSGAANLTIDWTAVGFGPSTGAFAAVTGGTLGTGATISYSTFYSTADTVPAGSALTSALAFITPGGFNGSDNAAVGALGSPFSLTQEITIIDTRAATSSGSATLTAASVPDAGSPLILLGTTMSMLGVYSRLRSKRQKA